MADYARLSHDPVLAFDTREENGTVHMTEIDLLLVQIDQAYNRRSWHGTNLRGSIRGMTTHNAAWRPRAGRHSVQEIVVHAAYWKYTGRRRLAVEKRGSFQLPGSRLAPW